jgi:hypothetical protein
MVGFGHDGETARPRMRNDKILKWCAAVYWEERRKIAAL